MRTLKQLFFVLVAATLLFTSCKTTKSDRNLVEAIPDSVIFVASFETKQIVDKGELSKFKEFNLYNIMRKEAVSENEKLATMLDEFLTDTRTSGLNLDQFFIYGINRNDNFNAVYVFKMDDASKFENKLKELMTTSGAEESDAPVDKGAYKQLSLDYTGDFVWNKDLAFFVAGNYSWDDEDETPVDYAYLFAEMPKNITANADFTEFMSKKNDIGFWASYDQIMNVSSSLLEMVYGFSDMSKLSPIDMTGCALRAGLNFNEGEVKVAASMTPKSKMDEFLKLYPILSTNFDADLLKFFPEKSYTTMKFSINVQEYVRLLKDQVGKISEAKKAKATESEGEEDENEMMSYYGDPMAELETMLAEPNVAAILNGLGGNVVLSIYDFQQGIIPMPLGGLIFDVKNQEVFDVIISLIPTDILKKQPKYYTLVSGPMVVGYIAFNNNKVFATNDEKAVTAFIDNKGFDKNLGNSSIASNLKSDIFYWNINTDMAAYPEHIIMLLRNAIGREFNMLQSFINIYKGIEYKVTKDCEVEFVVKMQNDQNSLKVILKNLDENIPAAMGM